MEIIGKPQQEELGQSLLALSQEAQEVLQAALDEAASFGRGYYIDTADLLIGLSQTGDTGVRLRELGITINGIRDAKQEIGGYDYFQRLQPSTSSTAVTTWQQLPRTTRMHKIGIMLTNKATSEGKELVEPEDMLEVIVKEGQGTGAKVLNHLGITRELLFPSRGESQQDESRLTSKV